MKHSVNNNRNKFSHFSRFLFSKKITPFVVLFILILLGIGGYFFTLQSRLPKDNPDAITEIPLPPTPTPVIDSTLFPYKNFLLSLQQTLSISGDITERKNIDWTTADGHIVPLMGTAVDAWDAQHGQYVQISQLDTFFAREGFAKSNLNYNKSTKMYTLYGYASDGMDCLVSKSTMDTQSSVNVFCGILDSTQLSWRDELAPLINPKNDPTIVWYVSNLIGNYAAGVAGDGAAGASWYAVKINGQWKDVWDGQNYISCKAVQQYAIPKAIYNQCSSNY